ncbi:MAG TPA: NUDIX hydrolase [Caulobacteraceae bacterium]|jgi:8-oxo-dGTP pyrophosphatase MutT (NUDIX family)
MKVMPDWMRPMGRPWEELSSRTAFENPWLRLTEHEARAPTGSPAAYAVVGFKNLAIGVLPVHQDGTIVMVGQHRFPCRDYSWEIPEGGEPVGGDPLGGAKRELREEAGLEASEWREVIRFQLSNSVTDERGFGFLATGLTQAETDPDHTEDLQLARVPFRNALELALGGAFPDMITIAMLLRAYHMAREGELPRALARAMLG